MKIKKYYINTIIFSLFLVVVMSCKFKQKNESVMSLTNIVQNIIGKKLLLPSKMDLYSPFVNYIADTTQIANSELKIYTQINASCGTCVKKIEKWNDLASELRRFEVPIVLIFKSEDRFEALKYMCESGIVKYFSYPFFFDEKNEYRTLNKFMESEESFKTVLTDKNNTILLMGDPILSKEMKKLFINEIQRIKNNNSKK